jgi:hypothetical protein
MPVPHRHALPTPVRTIALLHLLVPAAALVALHPARAAFFRIGARPSAPLAALWLVAAVPAAAYATAMLDLAGFAVFWDGQMGRVVEQGGIGAAISLILLAGAIAFPNAFG